MPSFLEFLARKPKKAEKENSAGSAYNKQVINQEFARSSNNRNGANGINPYPIMQDFGGARVTVPRFMTSNTGTYGLLPKKSQQQLGLDYKTLSTMSVNDVIDILSDAHPDLSFSIWNFLRIANGDFTVEVRKPGSGRPFTAGVKAIEEFFDRLRYPNTDQFQLSYSIESVLGQLFLTAITRGSCGLELVLTPDKTDVQFLAPIDTGAVDFKYENYRFVPYMLNQQLLIDTPTVMIERLDPRVDDPYGRSPLVASLFPLLYQIQILQDVKAVVHNQGFPRFDIKILEEVLLKRMPIAIRNNEQLKQEWLNNKLKEIIDMYNSLNPDDSFVHFDSIEIGMAGGTSGGVGAMIDPEKLMKVVDNLVISGAKTVATILGRRGTGNTGDFAKLEIKLYIQTVRAFQQVVERLMSRALTMLLNIQGKQGIVEFKFNPIEIRTELEQAQFQQTHYQNIAYLRDQGWIDQDTASMMAVGKPAVSPAPLFDVAPRGTPNPNTSSGTGEAGGNTGITPSNDTSNSSGDTTPGKPSDEGQ